MNDLREPPGPRLRRPALLALLALALLCTLASAQYRGGGRRGPIVTSDRYGVPEWKSEPGFARDAFTFARVRYSSGYGRGRGGGWATDYRDADLNLSYRLHQITSLQVDPEGKVLELTDPELREHPFLYIAEPGRLFFSEEEVLALRKHLLNGGFLLIDDFWGVAEYENLYEQIKRVFPDREPAELPEDHPIFHCVFDLKTKPQIPGVHSWLYTGETYEREDAQKVEYKGLFDDRGRLMVVIGHNTDLGDGWEEEATNPDYFRKFSEKYAYPLAINILFYTMTH
jgi:hypothetical protein